MKRKERAIVLSALVLSALCFGIVAVYSHIEPDVQSKSLTRFKNNLTIEAVIDNVEELHIYLHNTTDWGGLVWIRGDGSRNSTQGIIEKVTRNYYTYDEANNWVNFSYTLTVNKDFRDTENTLKYLVISPWGITIEGSIPIE